MENIKTAAYDDDRNIIIISFEKGVILLLYCGWVETRFGSTMTARAELDWLLDHDPTTYAELVLSGRMQGYLNGCQRDYARQRKNTSDEFMMYSKLT